jgi:hypothetical protein
MKKTFYILFALGLFNGVCAQNNKGIHFQGIARSESGMIIAKKQITLRISIVTDTLRSNIEYQEIKSVTTNVLGLFYTDIGVEEAGKVITIGVFDLIQWQKEDKYLQVEVDPNNSLHFLPAGFEKINYVPYAFYAQEAKMITSIVPIELGGTGVSNKIDILKSLDLEKVNNTPDSLKPASNAVNIALNDKLKKTDTLFLSNRIHLKLNSADTLKLSNRINFKLNSSDTTGLVNRINNKLNSLDTSGLSNRINALNNMIPKSYYCVFYDTAKQTAFTSTATPVKFNFKQIANKISIANNTANNPTRIVVLEAGIFQVNYHLQFIKSDAGTDEIIVWFRKNSAAIAYTNNTYIIQGSGIKNTINNNFLLELDANDYIELFFSVKNVNTALQGTTSTTATPSRPATPAASISMYTVN